MKFKVYGTDGGLCEVEAPFWEYSKEDGLYFFYKDPNDLSGQTKIIIAVFNVWTHMVVLSPVPPEVKNATINQDCPTPPNAQALSLSRPQPGVPGGGRPGSR